MIEEAQKHCQMYGMDEVFTLVTTSADQIRNPGGVEADTFNLFNIYLEPQDLELNRIYASTKHYHIYGQNYDLQNLNWSESFFANCCKSDLIAKIKEKMKLVDEIYHRGPLYFYDMIQIILNLSKDGADVLKDQIKSLTMQAFQGKNVTKTVTLLLRSYRHLEVIGGVPLDFARQLNKMFETCSVTRI